MRDATKILSQIIFWIAVCGCFVGRNMDNREAVYMGVWVAILVTGTYGMRCRIGRLLPFLGSHLLLILIGGALIRALGVTAGFEILILLTVYSLMLRLLSDASLLEEPGYFQLGVLAVCIFVNSYYKAPQKIIGCLAGAFFVILLLKILSDNLKAAEEFIRNRASSTQIDEKNLRRLNNWMSLLYVGALGVILALTGLFRTEGVSRGILNGIQQLLRWLVGKIGGSSEAPSVEISPEPELGFGKLPAVEKSQFVQVMEVVIQIVGTAVCIAGAVGLAAVIIIGLRRRFYGRQSMEGAVEDFAEPLTLRSELKKKPRKAVFEAFDPNPGKRIRRLYRKSMKNMKKQERWDCMSPGEQLEQYIRQEHMPEERRQEILRLYEKARYSAARMTEGEVKQMQELLRSQD